MNLDVRPLSVNDPRTMSTPSVTSQLTQRRWLRMRVLILAVGLGYLCLPVQPVASAQQKSLRTKQVPTSCEQTSLFRDEVAVAARKVSDAQVILIARRGTGEHSRGLSRRRLSSMQAMFRDWSGLETVGAEGEPVSGLGRVEVYVAGRHFRVFLFARGKFVPDCTGI